MRLGIYNIPVKSMSKAHHSEFGGNGRLSASLSPRLRTRSPIEFSLKRNKWRLNDTVRLLKFMDISRFFYFTCGTIGQKEISVFGSYVWTDKQWSSRYGHLRAYKLLLRSAFPSPLGRLFHPHLPPLLLNLLNQRSVDFMTQRSIFTSDNERTTSTTRPHSPYSTHHPPAPPPPPPLPLAPSSTSQPSPALPQVPLRVP